MTNEVVKDFACGLMYHLIKDAPQKYDEVIKLVENERSMEKLINAHYNLAVMYHKGIGVPKNYDDALKSYGIAEREGHARAKNNMGAMFQKGQMVDEDHRIALKLYREAAGEGLVLGQYNLGAMYYYSSKEKEEIEIIRDLTQAYIWISISVANGLYIGNRLLEHIEPQMTQSDLIIAQQHARQYWEANRENWEKAEE